MDTGYATRALKLAIDRTAAKEGEVPWVSAKDADILIGMWKLQNNIPAAQTIKFLDYPSVLFNSITAITSQASDVLRSLATNYVLCQGIDFSKVKSVAGLLGSDQITPPPNLGTQRNSASYLIDNGINQHRHHTMTLKAGGTLSDVLLVQKNKGNAIY